MSFDLHFHLLPGIDDGPETPAQSLELARAAVSAGTGTVVATPHVSFRYTNSARDIRREAAALARLLEESSVPLEVATGAEIAISHLDAISPTELDELTLGGGPWLLIEPPFGNSAAGVEAIVGGLQRRGHRILIAHPERCPGFRRDRRVLELLVERGALTSVTAGSLTGGFGREARAFATRLLNDGLAHNVASDAHDTHQRTPEIVGNLRHAGLDHLVPWLTVQVPQAILAGNAIPARPRGVASQRLRMPRRLGLRRAS